MRISEYSDSEMRELARKIPYIKFPNDCEVKATPPYEGALIRYYLRKNEKTISIYLYYKDNLGLVGEPYWEIYSPGFGDPERYVMADIEGLMEGIDKIFGGK